MKQIKIILIAIGKASFSNLKLEVKLFMQANKCSHSSFLKISKFIAGKFHKIMLLTLYCVLFCVNPQTQREKFFPINSTLEMKNRRVRSKSSSQ